MCKLVPYALLAFGFEIPLSLEGKIYYLLVICCYEGIDVNSLDNHFLKQWHPIWACFRPLNFWVNPNWDRHLGEDNCFWNSVWVPNELEIDKIPSYEVPMVCFPLEVGFPLLLPWHIVFRKNLLPWDTYYNHDPCPRGNKNVYECVTKNVR